MTTATVHLTQQELGDMLRQKAARYMAALTVATDATDAHTRALMANQAFKFSEDLRYFTKLWLDLVE